MVAEIGALAKLARIALPRGTVPVDDGAGEPESLGKQLGLTDRELEVLALLIEGRTNREIGESLFISEKTASVHVSRILAKLEVRGRVEAATKAQRLGIAK